MPTAKRPMKSCRRVTTWLPTLNSSGAVDIEVSIPNASQSRVCGLGKNWEDKLELVCEVQ